MASNHVAHVSAFIEGAPPGELTDVLNDIKALTLDQPNVVSQAQSAFQKYHEEQLTVVKLPGTGKEVLVSEHNSLGDGRYYDIESERSFAFDHVTQKATGVQDHEVEHQHGDLIPSLAKSFSLHASEHYPTSTTAIIPSKTDNDTITLLLAANKYSPSNFWNGRLRTQYTYSASSSTLTGGVLKCDVHYYEDGNVRLTTSKKVEETKIPTTGGGGADAVVREIAKVERKWQEELNRGFTQLSEGSFKGLRRQLPVTRQKMEWEKVSGLRVGREIGGMKR